MINQQTRTTEEFKAAMFKLSNLGQPIGVMTDCSELIPVPPPAPASSAVIPDPFVAEDITQACPERHFVASGIQKRNPQ